MTPPAVPPPNVRSSPGAVSVGRVSTTPFVVQLLALLQVTLSPGVPTAASPSNVAGAASPTAGMDSAAAAAAAAENARYLLALARTDMGPPESTCIDRY